MLYLDLNDILSVVYLIRPLKPYIQPIILLLLNIALLVIPRRGGCVMKYNNIARGPCGEKVMYYEVVEAEKVKPEMAENTTIRWVHLFMCLYMFLYELSSAHLWFPPSVWFHPSLGGRLGETLCSPASPLEHEYRCSLPLRYLYLL